MREVKIDHNMASQRLDKFLKRYLPEAGGSFIYKQLRKKNITLNDKKAKGSELLAEGDSIKIFFAEETIAKFMGTDAEPHTETGKRSTGEAGKSGTSGKTKQVPVLRREQIVYEDAQVMLINKPAGMLSQKAEQTDVSLVELLQSYLLQEGALTQEDLRIYSPGVVNRLDRNTSGLVLAAKTLPAAQLLSKGLKGRSFEKYYLALVTGEVKKPAHVRAWLRKDAGRNKVEVRETEAEGFSFIETKYVPLAVCEAALDETHRERCTLLCVELLTGKTHQIRSHLSFVRHPIIGDVKYGIGRWNTYARQQLGLKRQFLHAWKLVFPSMEAPLQAMSGQTYHAELPADLRKVTDKLEITGVIRANE